MIQACTVPIVAVISGCEKEKEYFTFRYTNQQNLTKLKSVIEIVNWAELPAHNNPSQACRKFLQKYTATIYNRCFSLKKKILRLKGYTLYKTA